MYPRSLIVCLFALFLTTSAFAQFGLKAHMNYGRYSERKKVRLQRYYIGYGFPSMNVDIKQEYTNYNLYDPSGNLLPSGTGPGIDTFIRKWVHSSKSMSLMAGTYFPFAKFGKESMIALDVSWVGDVYNYQVGSIRYSGYDSIKETGFCEVISLPMALVFKTGGDVSLNKKSKTMFTFGVGIAPAIVGTKIIDANINFSMRKYVMAEFGIFGGIAWKVRASYYFGNMLLIDNPAADFKNVTSYSGDASGQVNIQVTGAPAFNLTFMIMPFSYHWSKGDEFNY